MEDFLKEVNNREKVFEFIKDNIEFEAQKLYTKTYNIDFLVVEFLNKRLSDVVSHFKNSIDETQVVRFSRELASSFVDFNDQIENYTQKNSLEFKLKK